MNEDSKPTPAEIHRAVEFAKTCPPGINRTAAWAHELAEYRAELARDPAFVLGAAERLLRDAGVGLIRLDYESPGEAGIYYCSGQENTLAIVHERLLAARKAGG